MAHTDFTAVDYPDPNTPVTDDRLYYRDDGVLRARALRGEKLACRVFFGLRRYGKTSFLRRLERECASFQPPMRTLWLSASENPARLYSTVEELIEDFEAGDIASCRVLLDDIQEFDKQLLNELTDKARQATRDLIEQFATKLQELLALEPNYDLRLILCEPTNLSEWLESESPTAAGPLFASLLLSAAKPEPDNMLPPLDDGGISGNNQAHRLLSAMVDGTPRFKIDEQVAGELCRHFGGNPWLLAHAHGVIRNQGYTDPGTITEAVEDKLLQSHDDVERIGTIYKSLSSLERFFVRLVYDAQLNGGESARILKNKGSSVWCPQGLRIALRMPQTGLVDGKLGQGFSLTTVLSEYLRTAELRGYDLHKSTRLEDAEAWERVLRLPYPNSSRSAEFIIHQFSDLYLDNGPRWSEAWSSYIGYLKTLEGPTADRRPDVIVISGSVLGFPKKDRPHHEERLLDYRARLKYASDQILLAVDYLHPSPTNHSATQEQIIMVPGIFDLDWSPPEPGDSARHPAGKSWKDRYLEIWLEFFGEITHPGKVFIDHARDVKIFPINTASLETVAKLDRKAAQDLTSLRHALQQKLYEDWRAIHFSKRGEMASLSDDQKKLSQSAAARLLRATLHYIIEEEVGGPISNISEPTFRFLGIAKTSFADGDGDQPYHILADIGFVSESDKVTLKHEAIERAAAAATRRARDVVTARAQGPSRADPEPVRLAVTHHLPHHRRHAGVVEIFNAVEFRQELARAGINIVMHGHSDRQQMLTEKVLFKPAGKSGNTRNDSTTLDLIGTLPCSRFIQELAECAAMEDGSPFDGAPGFIEIKIAPNHTSPRSPRIISTTFNEIADNGHVNAFEGASLPVASATPQ